MSILSKIEKIVDAVTTIDSIANKINSSGILNGININNIKPGDISSAGSTIQSNIQSMTSGLTTQMTASFDTSQFEDLATSIKPEDMGIDMNEITKELNMNMGDFKDMPGFDMSEIENAFNGISFR